MIYFIKHLDLLISDKIILTIWQDDKNDSATWKPESSLASGNEHGFCLLMGNGFNLELLIDLLGTMALVVKVILTSVGQQRMVL